MSCPDTGMAHVAETFPRGWNGPFYHIFRTTLLMMIWWHKENSLVTSSEIAIIMHVRNKMVGSFGLLQAKYCQNTNT